MCLEMTEAPIPALSPSERQTLRHLAEGDFPTGDLDWLAVQRLKKMGLVEDRGGRAVTTKEGQRVLGQLAGSR